MSQITIRAAPDLIFRVKQAAAAAGKSMNEYVVWALEICTDPTYEDDERRRVRDKLRRAGLLVEDREAYTGPSIDRAEFEQARREAGKGTPSHVLIREDRDGP
jgi:hypothetical protein